MRRGTNALKLPGSSMPEDHGAVSCRRHVDVIMGMRTEFNDVVVALSPHRLLSVEAMWIGQPLKLQKRRSVKDVRCEERICVDCQ